MENVPTHVNHVMESVPRHVEHVAGYHAKPGPVEDARQGNKQGKGGDMARWDLGPRECAGNPEDSGRRQGSGGAGGRHQSQDRMRDGDAACGAACRGATRVLAV